MSHFLDRLTFFNKVKEPFANGHGVGMLAGDGLQMPGVFVLHHGQVLREFRHESAADRPDYLELAQAQGKL